MKYPNSSEYPKYKTYCVFYQLHFVDGMSTPISRYKVWADAKKGALRVANAILVDLCKGEIVYAANPFTIIKIKKVKNEQSVYSKNYQQYRF